MSKPQAEKQKNEVRYRRGRRKKKKGHVLSSIILVIALVVFAVSAYNLAKYAKGYLEGRNEYKEVQELVIEGDKPEGGFKVDFDRLLEINPDTVAWIRFHPEPSIISYPVVQGVDDEEYLHKTFADSENTVGAIFLASNNNEDFTDAHSIIYGHYMNDKSMFYHLSDYMEKSFWEQNPYFYIYTPDGRERKYHIYSAGIVNAYSDIYLTKFASGEEYQAFLNMTKETAAYDTGIEVSVSDTVVTLSTCTSADDDSRHVVHGVLENEILIE